MWKNININKQNIKADTGRAILINCSHKSEYDGWSFWHPAKLVRDGKHSNAVSISYTDDFTFNLKKYGNGKWNKNTIIDEKVIGVEEFEKAFGVMDENITAPIKDTDSYLIIEEPKKIEKDVKIVEELKNE